MKPINLLPKATFLEQYKKRLAVVIALLSVIVSMYWALPYYSQAWNHYMPPQEARHFAQHSLYTLKIVGYLGRETHATSEDYWSMVQAPDGRVSTLKAGDCVGREAGQVSAIKANGIYFHLPLSKETLFVPLYRSTHA